MQAEGQKEGGEPLQQRLVVVVVSGSGLRDQPARRAAHAQQRAHCAGAVRHPLRQQHQQGHLPTHNIYTEPDPALTHS